LSSPFAGLTRTFSRTLHKFSATRWSQVRQDCADLVTHREEKRPYTRRTKPDNHTPQPEIEEVPKEPDQPPPATIALDEADPQLLHSAAVIQAKADGPAAKERFEKIEQLLLA
jgi:hypothetical protein